MGLDCDSCKTMGLCEPRGCLPGIPSVGIYYTPEEPDGFRECPMLSWGEDVRFLYQLYAGWVNHHLPEHGGVMDQSNVLVESFMYLDSLKSEEFEKKMKSTGKKVKGIKEKHG